MTEERVFTLREVSAILAGLRLLQQHLRPVEGGDDVQDILDCGGQVLPLTAEEINTLCEKVNT